MHSSPRPSDLDSWVRQYTPALYSWARYKVSDRQAAEDLVQETFLTAAEKLDTFEGRSEPRTWLFGILNNKIAAFYRARMKQTMLRAPDGTELGEFFAANGSWSKNAAPSPWSESETELLDIPEFRTVLEDCLHDLPIVHAACLTYRFLDERPAEEICQELGISSTNYWQVLHRAKLRLRRCLQTHWFDQE